MCYSEPLTRRHGYYVEGAGWLLEGWKYVAAPAPGRRVAPLAQTEDDDPYVYRLRSMMRSAHGFHVLGSRAAAIELLQREHGDHPRRRYVIVRCLVPEAGLDQDGHPHQLYMRPNGGPITDDDIQRATGPGRRAAREEAEIEAAVNLLRARTRAPELVEVIS